MTKWSAFTKIRANIKRRSNKDNFKIDIKKCVDNALKKINEDLVSLQVIDGWCLIVPSERVQEFKFTDKSMRSINIMDIKSGREK